MFVKKCKHGNWFLSTVGRYLETVVLGSRSAQVDFLKRNITTKSQTPPPLPPRPIREREGGGGEHETIN